MKNRSPRSDDLPLFDADALAHPAAETQTGPNKARIAKAAGLKKPVAEKKAPSRSPQPLLAGLSLRGRPPKRDKPTNTERATGSRNRRMAAGGRRLELMLNAEETRLLDLLAEHQGLSRTEVVRQMILRSAKRLPKTVAAPGDKTQS